MIRRKIASAIVAVAACAALALPTGASAVESVYWSNVVVGCGNGTFGYVNNNVEVDKGSFVAGRYRSIVTGKLYSTWRVGFRYANGTQAYAVVGPLNNQSGSKANDFTSSNSNPFIRNVTGGGYYEASACYLYN